MVDAPPLAWKVSISQGEGNSNSKAHKEPRNDPQQPPVMLNRWGKWGGGTAVDWQPDIALASTTTRMIIMISDEQMNDTELRRR